MDNVTLGGHPAPGIIPEIPEPPPLDDLEAAIRTHVADFHQARALERSVFHRFALATLLIITPALVATGMLVQQFLIDPPNPWRDWIWEAYGTSIATCISRHTHCTVTIEPAGT
ncbi:MAG: hypothetical protein OXE57_01330 [Alphaproteobacteria bacterium]|nr:hypothetical protein [Alphaproteobacteria bacterium]